ncbi:MAG: cobyrinate a,c-diamide synthase [Pseudomonadota bacterium]
MSRFVVSAVHKSSGKTTVSVGLAAALRARGHAVQTFKKGPDYIDPLWLARASDRPCYNLDFHTQSHDEIVASVAARGPAGGVALIEGNMGLHDGVDLEGSDSTAALAKLLEAPVVLVVDAEGVTRGVSPIVNGMIAFDPEVRFAGVILNRIATARQQAKLVAAIERYSDARILGCIGRDAGMQVVERHLGLTTPAEAGRSDDRIDHLARVIGASVDLDALLAAAGAVAPLPSPAPLPAPSRADVRIAVAMDSAFCFYYADDLEALARAGAELTYFSPLTAPALPEADALFIGGGYPETHMRQLEANSALRAEIRHAADAGLPIYAECGGLMYLSRAIAWHGERCEMVGIVPAETQMHDTPQGRGLVRLEPTGEAPWSASGGADGFVPAHEFHHAALTGIDPGARFAYRVARGYGIDGAHDGIVVGNMLASFSHMRDTSRNRWAGRFVDFVRTARSARHARLVRRVAGS